MALQGFLAAWALLEFDDCRRLQSRILLPTSHSNLQGPAASGAVGLLWEATVALSSRVQSPSRGCSVTWEGPADDILSFLQACHEDYVLSQKLCFDFGSSSLQQE